MTMTYTDELVIKTSGQSYNGSTIVNNDSRKRRTWLENCPYYESRLIIYNRKLFIGLATEVDENFETGIWY